MRRTTHGFDYFFGTAGCSTTDPAYANVVKDLKAELRRLRTHLGDTT